MNKDNDIRLVYPQFYPLEIMWVSKVRQLFMLFISQLARQLIYLLIMKFNSLC